MSEPEGTAAELPRTHAELDALAAERGVTWSREGLTVAEKQGELGGTPAAEAPPETPSAEAPAEEAPADTEPVEETVVETIEVPVDVLRRYTSYGTVEEIQAELDRTAATAEIKAEGRAEMEAYEPEDLQEQAELSSSGANSDLFEDPVVPPPIVSTAVDDHAQKDDAARAAAIPLQEFVAEKYEERPENAGQHVVAGEYADRGETWPPPEEDPAALVEARDQETADSLAAAKEEAEELAGQIDVRASLAPRTIGDVESEDEELSSALRPSSGATEGSFSVGDAVSRLDEATDEIGVVLEIDRTNENHVLVEVAFPSGKAYLNLNNLRYEGKAADFVSA